MLALKQCEQFKWREESGGKAKQVEKQASERWVRWSCHSKAVG